MQLYNWIVKIFSCSIFVMCLWTKKICKQNFKKTDLWCTAKQKEKSLFQLCVQQSNVHLPCIMADFKSFLIVPHILIIQQCTIHLRQLSFFPSGRIILISFLLTLNSFIALICSDFCTFLCLGNGFIRYSWLVSWFYGISIFVGLF